MRQKHDSFRCWARGRSTTVIVYRLLTDGVRRSTPIGGPHRCTTITTTTSSSDENISSRLPLRLPIPHPTSQQRNTKKAVSWKGRDLACPHWQHDRTASPASLPHKFVATSSLFLFFFHVLRDDQRATYRAVALAAWFILMVTTIISALLHRHLASPSCPSDLYRCHSAKRGGPFSWRGAAPDSGKSTIPHKMMEMFITDGQWMSPVQRRRSVHADSFRGVRFRHDIAVVEI
jgi:hypothetical protein